MKPGNDFGRAGLRPFSHRTRPILPVIEPILVERRASRFNHPDRWSS